MKEIKLVFVGILGLGLCVLFGFSQTTQEGAPPRYEYQIITSVASIIPSGLGRSRLINSLEQKNYKDYTSTRTASNNTRNKAKRKDIRVQNFEETKLLNFYNIASIRFQNIAANDAVVSSKINDMAM